MDIAETITSEATKLFPRSLSELPNSDTSNILSSQGSDGIVYGDTSQTRLFLRYAPEFIDDPQNTGMFAHIKAAIYKSPAPAIAALSSSVVVGYRTLISKDCFYNDQIYLDRQHFDRSFDRLAIVDPFPNEDTGLRRDDSNGPFILETQNRETRKLDGPTIVLCSQEPSNFGSFMFRVLPKLETLNRFNVPSYPVLVYARSEATIEFLELAGIARERIRQHQPHIFTVCDKAIIPTLRNPDAFLDYETRIFFARLRSRFGARKCEKRLYISRLGYSRNSGSSRLMLNEETLIHRLLKIGFEIIEPEKLTAAQQVEAFSSAAMVVGPAGSAMFNCVFCEPGTKLLDIESEPHWIYAHAGLFASCELRYGIFVGQSDPTDLSSVHRRWAVDIERLLERIDSFTRS